MHIGGGAVAARPHAACCLEPVGWVERSETHLW